MKKYALIFFFAPALAFACPDFSGLYNFGPSGGFNNWLKVQQFACASMVLTICSGKGSRPVPGDCNRPGPPIVFDGKTEGPGGAVYKFNQDQLIEDSVTGKTIAIGTIKHGLCSTKRVTWSLDANHALNMSELSVYNCEDNFQGANADVYPLVN